MLFEGKVGQQTLTDGAVSEIRLDRTGAQAITAAHARYLDAVLRGNCFMASMQAAAALGTALTGTAVNMVLYNPAGSGKNLNLLQVGLAVVVATSAGFVVYAVLGTPGQAAPTATTVLPSGIQNCLVGAGSAPVGVVYSAATLPTTPVARRVLAGIVSTAPASAHSIVDDLQGSIVLAPGAMLAIQGITTNATGVISVLWEEVPV